MKRYNKEEEKWERTRHRMSENVKMQNKMKNQCMIKEQDEMRKGEM